MDTFFFTIILAYNGDIFHVQNNQNYRRIIDNYD